MKNKVKSIKVAIAGFLVLVGVFATPLVATTATYAAINPKDQACLGTGGTPVGGKCTGNSQQADLTKIIKTIVNVLLFVLGVVAVIVIIIAGFRYVTSAGDASRVKAAKDTILYAVIGLIVAILAYAIVNFVLRNVK